jgi:hypothetical protein
MHVRTSLVAVCASFALAVTVSPAWAEQPEQPPTALDQGGQGAPPKPKYHKLSQLSKAEKSAVKLASRLTAKATKGRVLDYKRADKYDQGHPVFRRRFTAGWLFSGGKVTNISHKERKAVRRFIPKGDPYWMLPKDVFGVPHCTGKSKSVQRGRSYHETWHKSCRTARIIWVYASAGILLGVLGAAMPPPPPS